MKISSISYLRDVEAPNPAPNYRRLREDETPTVELKDPIDTVSFRGEVDSAESPVAENPLKAIWSAFAGLGK